jgi:DNA processing protein
MDIHTLLHGSPDYPAELLRLDDPPELLRVRGTLPPRERMVAMVGTREASERARSFAEELAEKLAMAGCAIISGGALGIDTCAHEGALRGGGKTVVVQAPGLSHLYPPENLPLFERVREAGCELSEHSDESPPLRRYFLARNRIIAALARVVIVVEAPFPSGAISTAHAALKMGVPLLVVPAFPTDAHAEGSNLLLRLGARVCLSEADALSVVDGAPTPEAIPTHILQRPKKPRVQRTKSAVLTQATLDLDLPVTLAAVLDAVAQDTVDLDTLAARAGLPFDVLQGRVTELELLGALSVDAVGRVTALARNR